MPLAVRPALTGDIPYIHDLSRRVQDIFDQSGSLQQIGPIPVEQLEAAAAQQHLYLFAIEAVPAGCVLIEPLTADQGRLWGVEPEGLWFLSKFMLEPDQRGKGLGVVAMRSIQTRFRDQRGIVLDCWAGNDKLRAYYKALGCRLHGVFDEEDYQIAVFIWQP